MRYESTSYIKKIFNIMDVRMSVLVLVSVNKILI
jgi:hypothetical protein